MVAAWNGRRHNFLGFQLVITGLVLVTVGGCKSTENPPQANMTPAVHLGAPQGPGSDTPIVISGGSIHFRARGKGAAWLPCDGKKATSETACYKAPFSQTDKANLQNYQFLNANFGLTPEKVNTGWEIDVVDINPDNQTALPTKPMQHGVIVCAESSNFTSCDLGKFTSGSIYLIAIGGTFDVPTSAHPRKLVYHDADTSGANDYINDIRLNASGGVGGTLDEFCDADDHYCTLFLSK